MSFYTKDNEEAVYYKYIQGEQEDGETLLLLHGIGLELTMWEKLIPYLHDYNILMLDIRGHGRTQGSMTPVQWSLFIDDIVMLVEHLGIKVDHIVGHGLGAFLAYEIIHKEILPSKSLTIVSTPFYYPIEPGKKGVQYRRDHSDNLADLMIHFLLAKKTEEHEAYIRDAFGKVNLQEYFEVLEFLYKNTSIEKLKNIEVPVFMLSGEHDLNYPPQLLTYNAHFIKNVRTLIVPAASNLIPMEQPVIMAKWLIDFYENLKNDHSVVTIPYLAELGHHLHPQPKNESIPGEVRILNGFEFYYKGHQLQGNWSKRKMKEILTFLSIHQKVSRDQICDHIWPESLLKNAKNSLRVSLNHIKQLLKENNAENMLSIDHQTVSFEVPVICDAVTKWEQLKLITDEDDNDVLRDKLFKFLDDYPTKPFPHIFEDWILEYQYEIEERIKQALVDIYQKNLDSENKAQLKATEQYMERFGMYDEVMELVY
ncbi:alpha/beta hydrolase [Pontibacillus marinus]|uniref:AB hydrolase-1 domain-containing protein n=1 Tax=Pontibacillus marinus BH030004 = DSM 16465 TaxID=1385511 RepID=A0A0A5HSP6_9BACI|nr:alpha/beta hydrolase [Pontibacillus marinus]KGX86667.1 hypothetical protein N783_11770 [Pontibacillus marinus BH030004 = DSM 16465]